MIFVQVYNSDNWLEFYLIAHVPKLLPLKIKVIFELKINQKQLNSNLEVELQIFFYQ
jgi:hypothetical protein